MLNFSEKLISHEEVFVSRYQRLMAWSLKIAGPDQDKAEDLVHDAYVHWTLVRPDLASIRNLDGYFYAMLHNMHVAELRRAARNPISAVSTIEYDLAFRFSLRANDQLHLTHVQDQLRAVCDYACRRKETSKGGSLLLLRFFHGYYPGELARLAGMSRVGVDSWLYRTRAEAKRYLENLGALKSIKQNGSHHSVGVSVTPEPTSRRRCHPRCDGNNSHHLLQVCANGAAIDFLDEIVERIYHSCHSGCLSNRKFCKFYSEPEPETLDCESLAHIASCRSCLEKASKVLQLPARTDRHSPDRLGRDQRRDEKGFEQKNGAANGHGLPPQPRRGWTRRRRASIGRWEDCRASLRSHAHGAPE